MSHLSEATLQAFLDGTLGEERAAVQQHVQACHACRQQLAAYRAVYGQLTAEAMPPLPTDFSARVLSRLQTQKQPERDWLGWLVFAFSIVLSLGTAVYFFEWQRLIALASSGFREMLAFFQGWHTALQSVQVPWDIPWHSISLALFTLVAIALVDWVISQSRQRRA